MSKKKKIHIETEEEETETPEEETAKAEEVPVAEIVEDEEEGPSELEQAQLEAKEARDEMLRMRAETDNLRKRLQKEKQDSVQFANQRLIKQLIPIFENLDRALKAPDTNVESLKEGVQLTADQALALFKKENVEPIKAVGELFDPSIHEVLSQMESNDHDENTVIEEFSKGYRMNGRVLIPSRVVIAKKPAKTETDDKDNASTEAEAQA
ncbi:MAG: nucleotide exchange factor GrpE [Nitrospinota bacterium]|jgi:molecular chaperone GrpE|nr:nucleotide exchange factor GrpE [Nitrospinota bacterium]